MNTWKGKPLEDMSKEELIEALTELGEAYKRELTSGIMSRLPLQ